MNDKKEAMINSLRTNIYMAQNVANKDLAKRYLILANRDAVILRKLQAEWDADSTLTQFIYKAA